jgi:hypothetical protein
MHIKHLSFYFKLTIVVTLLMSVLTSFCHNNTEDVGNIYIFLLFLYTVGLCSLRTNYVRFGENDVDDDTNKRRYMQHWPNKKAYVTPTDR